MTPERWQQVARIYQSAMDQAPSARDAYVDRACGSDTELRREVESLFDEPSDLLSVELIRKILEDSPTTDFVALAPGTRLGPYEILSLIGRGGMGEVHRARDSRLGRDVAIKILSPHLASDESRRRFEREARAAAALSHPNIVTIYDVGQVDGLLYFAMEVLEGHTLREVAASGAMPVHRLLKIAIQLADGLATAHDRQIVHRDLKPENIIIGVDDTVKILDFGIAKTEVSAQRQAAVTPSALLRTRDGVILGTAGYMSPEQTRGLAVDHRSDQFALGAILYELAAGRRAFERASLIDAVIAVVADEPEPLDRFAMDVPSALQTAIERCLAKRPEDRYPSTRDLYQDLTAIRDRLLVDPQPHQDVYRPALIRFPHLALVGWPFPVVPDREYCKFMADRQELQLELKELLHSLSKRDTSSIHLFWAWFGAGKTHTLLYLAHQAELSNARGDGTTLFTVYSEFPKTVRGFLDIFRTFTADADLDRFADAYLEIRTCPSADVLQRKFALTSPDLASALHALALGDVQGKATAARWLRGDAISVAQLRSIGVTRKLDSAEEAVRLFAALAALLSDAARARGRAGARLIWILDEFQRIERCSAKLKEEINTGLSSTFNACPQGLSVFVSFSGNPQKSLPPWFSRELRDRIGRTKIFILPPMRSDEALTFVKDVLRQFRPSNFKDDLPYFPFTQEAVQTILAEIARTSELRPRAIMHAMSAVLEDADGVLERGELSLVDKDFALRALSQRVPLIKDEGSTT